MMTRGRTAYLVVMLAGLASLTACAGQTATAAAEALGRPVAARTSDVPPPAEGPVEPAASPQATVPPEPVEPAPVAPEPVEPAPVAPEPAGTGAAVTSPAPAVSPTVAKRQRWVKIFSGPSVKDITPPEDKTKGTNVVELNATESEQIGTYLTDGAGRTLYRFDKDSAKPPKSNCNGDCATAWPPLLIKSPGKIFPKGIDPKIIGYVERADGHCQVTINGWPVYYFVADAKPGDINGQGVNGKWFATSPDGAKTKAIPGFPVKSN